MRGRAEGVSHAGFARRHKCDSLRPSCTKCTRLHVQCLGYASDRPDWLKGDFAKLYTTAIKCFLSEYPAAKAYSDPVPFLVLKSNPEIEQWLAQDPGAFNPVCFDSETSSLKQWSPAAAPQPPSETHGAAFPGPTTSGEPAYVPGYPMPETTPRSHEPLTPSPDIPYTYPSDTHYSAHGITQGGVQGASWGFMAQDMAQPFQATPYVPSQQPVYDYSSQQGITSPSYYNHDEHTVHYVGPSE
ncbi:Fungal Zn(2)-Cys(6) binuclear cluster domain [Ceratobasidium sp. AG-Ba]|nr:Fungal Zn(2)-Cys(6) binuclear cluster domain [Ceratobasidium sp. AG-Ba]QRW01526.1 Fungal Zn(2)-Cys(6) binuclear cluster domain [Ceratobasidium sp. AG-Ba]